MNLINFFEKSVELKSDALAIRYPAGEITYGVLSDAVRRLSGGLQRLRIGRDSRVALILPNIPHYVISYLAILRTGGTVLPIANGLGAHELTLMLEEGEVDSVICWSGELKVVEEAVSASPLVRNVIVLGDKTGKDTISLTRLISHSQPIFEPSEIDDEEIAVIRLGSGRTGRYVAAEFTHHAITANAVAVRDTLEITRDDVILSAVPLSHPAGEGLSLNLFIAAGCAINLIPNWNANAIAEELHSGQSTIFATFPSHLRGLIEIPSEDSVSPALRFVLSTGERLDENTLKEFERRFGGYSLECYTMRDAGPVVSINNWRNGRRVGSLGHPLNGMEMRIINQAGKESSIGDVGEIVVRGSSVMANYTGRPRLTNVKMPDRWMRTGDIGRMDINGFFYYYGCEPDRIISNGTSFYCGEVERLLALHPEILETAVISTQGEGYTPSIKACVVPVPDSKITTDDIRNWLQKHLADYKLPKVIRFYKDLPRNKAGQIDRSELISVGADSIESEID